MTQTTPPTQAELEAKIIALAQSDPVFRAQLVADPKAAIKDLNGLELPDEISVQVHEESATSFHLVLPPSGELAEEELAAVFAACWECDFMDSI